MLGGADMEPGNAERRPAHAEIRRQHVARGFRRAAREDDVPRLGIDETRDRFARLIDDRTRRTAFAVDGRRIADEIERVAHSARRAPALRGAVAFQSR